MRIIEPSATIIENELEKLSIYQRIDRCAAVCYQRPPKPTEEEAQAFLPQDGEHQAPEHAGDGGGAFGYPSLVHTSKQQIHARIAAFWG